jgi:YcxB-like protein
MEIEYELTREDLYAFQWRSAYSSPRARRMAWKPYFFLFIVVLLVSLMGGIGADGFTFSFVKFSLLFVVFPIVALAIWLTTRITVRRFINQTLKEEKPERGQLGKHRVELQDSGVVESTAVNESSRTWAGIDRIEQDSNYIYIYTAPLMAIIIPKRAFKDVAAAKAFYELSETRRAAAAGDPKG